MTRDEWQALYQAKELLGLGEKATTGEIKRAYRSLCKQHHPDLHQEQDAAAMQALSHAYKLLVDYCEQYRIPLVPNEAETFDPEDWWMDRFGRDPLWGKNKGKGGER